MIQERKINWSFISSLLFGAVLAMLGYIVQQNDNRISKLEAWREEHERYARDRMVEIRSELSTIQTKLDRLIQDQRK